MTLWVYQQSTACKTQEHRHTTPPTQGVWASGQHAGHRQAAQKDGTERWHSSQHRQMAQTDSIDRWHKQIWHRQMAQTVSTYRWLRQIRQIYIQLARADGTDRWHRQSAHTDSPTCANSNTSSKSPAEQSAGRAIWQGRAVGHTAFCPWGLCSMKDWATCNER